MQAGHDFKYRAVTLGSNLKLRQTISGGSAWGNDMFPDVRVLRKRINNVGAVHATRNAFLPYLSVSFHS